MNLEPKHGHELPNLLLCLYKLFISKDCSLVEINPFVLMKDGYFLAIDSKVSFNDNALIRHPDIAKLRDTGEEDPREVEASAYNMNCFSLDGNFACRVNGVGRAKATIDLIMYYRSQPENFLDIVGEANEEQIIHAIEFFLKNANIHGILVNIFGGIVKCNLIAQGIMNAVRATKLNCRWLFDLKEQMLRKENNY
jgi:succinyl-CoA synthetase beta subunit